MAIGVLGMNHKTPMSIREKLSYAANEIKPAMEGFLPLEGVEEVVILSTCNRTEIYYQSKSKQTNKEVIHRIIKTRDIDRESLQDNIYILKDLDAVKHLYQVICGLDSMVLGEMEIAGQVKEAYYRSHELGGTGKLLNRLFQSALEVNKEVRSKVAIEAGPVSLSHVAVDKVERELGSLNNVQAMVIGAGEMGRLLLKYLLQHGIEKVYVANRTWERSKKITHNLGGEPIIFEEKGNYLGRVDILISATASPYYLIDQDDIPLHRDRPLYLIDLAVPRDIAPTIGRYKTCRLIDIDDLKDIAEENLEERKEAAKDAQLTIKKKVKEFENWLKVQDVTWLISSLKKKAEKIRKEEITNLDGKKLTREEVERLSRRIVNKLLHQPIIELKRIAKEREESANLINTISSLFKLD